MMEEIYLKCNFCNDVYSYKFEDNFIIAIDCEWRSKIEAESLLSDKPHNHEEYELLISGPLKMNLDDNFWSIYMNPNARLNGFESEQDIESVCFCLVKPLKIISMNDSSANLKIRVVKIIEINHPGKTENPQITGMNLLESDFKSKNYYHIENYSGFSLIDINIQSDLGLTIIIEKKNLKSRIVAVNDWDFHKNLWYSFNKELTKDEELKFGIQH